ncbi:hypothetical protein [Hyalangium rubrum]|uniref:Uncharacterized protein n=1 Tax=Hyalangium rubrum TaxID=3103134 RepID=A0ABU5HH40_9BACT|nr:hypothetical protein [Hyalangium sp. s54d21]MDY7232464.1 hypothetical protein [Hyalangium sp. s54d21]
MAFDLDQLREQLAAVPLVSPYSHDLAVAIICDTFRLGSARPPSLEQWQAFPQRFVSPLWREQVGMLAHVLASSSLREETVRLLNPRFDAMEALNRFFEILGPLTAEMVRSNKFRQEEFLRKWIFALGGEVKGERPKESLQRMNQLDYRKAMKDFEKAEAARKAEAQKREKMLQEAAQKAADARGWRE